MKNECDIGVHRQGSRKSSVNHHKRQKAELHGQGTVLRAGSQGQKGEGCRNELWRSLNIKKTFALFVFLRLTRSHERVSEEGKEIIS